VEAFLDTDIQERQVQQRKLSAIPKRGFIKNQSTVTNLLDYASFVLNSSEEG
jgi:hypothetical protein